MQKVSGGHRIPYTSVTAGIVNNILEMGSSANHRAAGTAIQRYNSSHQRPVSVRAPFENGQLISTKIDERRDQYGRLKTYYQDTVEVREADDAVLTNGQEVARGMPQLRGIPLEKRKKYYGRTILKDDEYWIIGTQPLSFDSRYWGAIHKSQLIGRAYVLF